MYSSEKLYNNLKEYIRKEIGTPLCLWGKICYRVIFGCEGITPVYSIKGTLSRGEYLIVLVFLSSIFSIIRWLQFPLITYCCGLLLFYAVLMTVQKRCRDLGHKGTVWILILTEVMLWQYLQFWTDAPKEDMLWNGIAKITGILTLSLSVLFFIPSKAGTDKNLSSSLLKYPFLYTAFCWAMAIGTSLWAKYYFLPE